MRKIYITTFLFSLILLSACNSSVQTVSSEPAEPVTPMFAESPATLTDNSVPDITGQVVDLEGQPVSGASVVAADKQTTTDQNGRFQLSAAGPVSQWVTVEHPDFLSRTRAAAPGSPVLVRLTPDDGETISIHFGGDVMFGRRFYDPNEDGDTIDGLLRPGDGLDEHLALLKPIRPLLENADLTVVNLESPLSTDPYINPLQTRPERFHETKDYVFAGDPVLTLALRQAGVDIVDIGNNHFYDILDEGVIDTLNGLEQAGFEPGHGYFGAGASAEDAWTPAVVTVRGQSLAFLGCTSISGVEHPITYVASNLKGGAAECDERAIHSAVEAAQAKYDMVIMMIHGGFEYGREPSNNIRRLTDTAREAGATLVINHHPHVVGGFDWDGSSLVAWTLGNFLFDQTVWPTFESYLLTVHLRQGQVVRAYTEPIMIEGYLPKGVAGEMADFVARGAAGREPGPFLIEDGAMEVDINSLATRHDVTMPFDADSEAGNIVRLEKEWWLSGLSGSGQIRLGRDLLWVGSFEDEDVDEQSQEGALWDLEGPDKELGPEYAYQGNVGLHLQRGSRNLTNLAINPIHRILVEPGTELSVIGMVRGNAASNLEMQLSWYPDTKGPSATQTVESIFIEADDVWQPFRLDATVPVDTVAMGLFIRLFPPVSGLTTVDLDNIGIIAWAPKEAPFSRLYDYVRVVGSGELTLSKDLLPGVESEIPPCLTVAQSDARCFQKH
jgi:poly-gamma-glutamate capsule biosynthesis protein CapA/YwtB (metallophosphatase superfamily)